MVRKTLLDNHLQLLRGLGIRPVAVIGSSMGLTNIFLQGGKGGQDKTFILADLSPLALELVALRHGAFVYSREAPKGSDQSWTDLIAREIGEAASTMRLGPEDTLERIILAGESSERAREEIKSSIPDCELLKDSLQVAVPGENGPHVQESASTLGLAFTGMVRRPSVRMNLLPAELRVRQTRWAYVPTVILGLAIIALLAALFFRQVAQNRVLIGELDQEIQSLKAPVEKAQSVRNQADALGNKIKAIEEVLRKRDMNLEILKELSALLPQDTFLSSYSYRDGIIQLTGLSGSSSDLIQRMEQSALFKDVVQRGPIVKDSQTGKDRFTLEAKLER
jgi:Tfp pilus assembly protein PilN